MHLSWAWGTFFFFFFSSPSPYLCTMMLPPRCHSHHFSLMATADHSCRAQIFLDEDEGLNNRVSSFGPGEFFSYFYYLLTFIIGDNDYFFKYRTTDEHQHEQRGLRCVSGPRFFLLPNHNHHYEPPPSLSLHPLPTHYHNHSTDGKWAQTCCRHVSSPWYVIYLFLIVQLLWDTSQKYPVCGLCMFFYRLICTFHTFGWFYHSFNVTFFPFTPHFCEFNLLVNQLFGQSCKKSRKKKEN